MSVYRPKGQEKFTYDFWWHGRRFSGSTGATSKREALQVEAACRAAAVREAEVDARRKSRPMTLDDACGRYWLEVGQHARRPEQIEWSLDYLITFFGGDRALTAIGDTDVAQLVAKRRGDRINNVMVRRRDAKLPAAARREPKRVSPATVNRSVIEPLRRIMLRARDVWGEKEVGHVTWRKHKLKEPRERIRALPADDDAKLFAALPAAYAPIVQFALRTGCRAMECINLRWADIDWGSRRITILGKGGKIAPIPLARDVRDLLFPLQRDGVEYVFMIDPKPRKDGFVEPARRITYRGFYSAFHRAAIEAGIRNLRIHDLRHTAATRVLKKTGNLKMAQRLLRHESISTTSKYAAVLDDDLRDALDSMVTPEVPVELPVKKAKSLRKRG